MWVTYLSWISISITIVLWLGIPQLVTYFFRIKQVPRPRPFGQRGSGERFFIPGESIALGYGVRHSDQSFAGRIGEAFPESSIRLLARPFKGTSNLLDLMPVHEQFDAVILTTSGNDLMCWSQRKLAKDLNEMIKHCARLAPHILVLGNFENLYRNKYFRGSPWYKFLSWVLQKIFESQGRKVKKTYQQVLGLHNLSSSLVEVKMNMFYDVAEDGVHPNWVGHQNLALSVIAQLRQRLK